MAEYWRFPLAALAAYLIGSLNGSLLVTRLLLRDDIRKHGSGNAGSTNMLRTYGVKLTIPVALWDMAKGVGAIMLAQWITVAGIMTHLTTEGEFLFDGMTKEDALLYAVLLGSLFAILGHVFPLLFRFKGGKGVITSLAVLLVVDWRAASAAFACFIVTVVIWRYISLGSLVAFTVFGILTAIFWYSQPLRIVHAVLLALLVFYLHRENIARLCKGTERKFGQKS